MDVFQTQSKVIKEKIFQVSEFNDFVSTYLEQIGEVVIEGEISEVKISQGKWLFATIKDKESNVDIFGLAFKLSGCDLLEAGMLVHVYGVPRLYKKTGRFSVFVNQIVPAGEGALRLALEKLKSKLEKEGLFDTARKRLLPIFPENIGLITAKGSDAYKDFVKVLKDRMGGLKIQFCPVSVQGKDATGTIISAFEYLNKHHSELDLIVLTRGGGSLEDLQPFNDEGVARAIFSSKIPVVSAVGHEANISVADLVADVRASTPTNAAEQIVRDRVDVVKEINFFTKNIEDKLKGMIKEKNDFVLEHVDVLKSAIEKEVSKLRAVITKFGSQLIAFLKDTNASGIKVDNFRLNLIAAVGTWLINRKNSLESLTRLLKSLDFQQVLKRGFSITIDKSGAVIKSVSKTKKGEKIATMLYNGKIGSIVVDIKK